MKNCFRFASLAVAVALFAGVASAQLPQLNGPTATLNVNGVEPGNSGNATLDAVNDIQIALPGNYVHNVTSTNSAAPLLMIASPVDPTTGATAPTPWLDTVDIGVPGPVPGNISVVGDGLGLTVNPLTDVFWATDGGNPTLGTGPTFTWALSAGTILDGAHVATQAVIQDLTFPPFNLKNTAAASSHFNIGQALLLLTGDDGFVQVPFVPGVNFEFHGVSYSDVYVNGNGYVNFGAPSTVPLGGFTGDMVGALNAEPAIFAGMTDWSPNVSPSGGVLYNEIVNTATGAASATASWVDCPNFAGTGLNNFAIALQTNATGLGAALNPANGQFDMNFAYDIASTGGAFRTGLYGHTPGGLALAGGGFDQDLYSSVVSVGAANEAQIEEHNFNGFAATINGFDGAGSARGGNDGLRWNNHSPTYIPTTAVLGGDLGYTTLSGTTAPADAFTGETDQPSYPNDGTVPVVLGGSFFNFSDATLAIADPGMTTTSFLIVNGVHNDIAGAMGNASAFATVAAEVTNPGNGDFSRHGGGLECTMIPVAPYTGPMDVYTDPDQSVSSALGFNGDETIVAQIVLSAPGAVFTSYTLGDDAGAMTHTLSGATVNFYDTTLGTDDGGLNTPYSSFILNPNGYITFGAPATDFTATSAEFFAGFQGTTTAPNPAIALMYCDLNRGGVTSGATFDVTEDLMTGDVTVSYNNQNWWASQAPAGTASVQMQAGGVFNFNHGAVVADTGSANVITGITDGDNTDLASDVIYPTAGPTIIGHTSTALSNESLGEESLSNAFTAITFNGTGAWTMLANGTGGWIVF